MPRSSRTPPCKGGRQALCDFAATGLLDCQLPGRNGLFTREADHRSYLILVLRLLQGASRSQMRKHLGSRDQLVDIGPPVIPLLAGVVLKSGVRPMSGRTCVL